MKCIAQDQATEPTKAVAYMRTSSATNVGADKDSEKRQRAAIEGYAKRAGMSVVHWLRHRRMAGLIFSGRSNCAMRRSPK